MRTNQLPPSPHGYWNNELASVRADEYSATSTDQSSTVESQVKVYNFGRDENSDKIKAFLRPNGAPDPDARAKLKAWVRSNVGNEILTSVIYAKEFADARERLVRELGL